MLLAKLVAEPHNHSCLYTRDLAPKLEKNRKTNSSISAALQNLSSTGGFFALMLRLAKGFASKMRLAYVLAAALLTPLGGVHAQGPGIASNLGGVHAQDPGDESLSLYAVKVGGGTGVYLGQGLVITAAHVVGSAPLSVRLANLDLPAKVIKESPYEQLDLALLAIDQNRLPVSLQLRRMPLCQIPPQAGEVVIVATPEGIARSTVMSPRLLTADIRAKFPTVIKDVATTGNSGSGVFDAERKCLLGVMSRKLFVRAMAGNSMMVKEKDIAKYFVPAATIAAFMPSGHPN